MPYLQGETLGLLVLLLVCPASIRHRIHLSKLANAVAFSGGAGNIKVMYVPHGGVESGGLFIELILPDLWPALCLQEIRDHAGTVPDSFRRNHACIIHVDSPSLNDVCDSSGQHL